MADVLRVCALYPDLMNIYADRGNLLLLERALRVARASASSSPASGLGDALDPDAHDLFYIGGGQDRDQALCAEDLADRQARRAARRGGARQGDLRRLRRLPAARPRLRARRRAAPGRRASSTSRPSARTARG